MNDLIRLTATEAVARLRRGEISPLELIDAAADRIAAVDPAVNALPTLCLDRARDAAKRLDRSSEGEAGWLAGLPLSIKDLTDVAGVRTTYGSPIFRDHVPAMSHPLVKRIERKGGIVLAKSNTPEFGAGGSTFNEVFGRTRNPWNTALTCGGSTGGGAVSVATGEVWLAHGTDHGGSLRRPGTYCSVVGLRPSPGRVTRGTSNNLFSPLSVHGPMARNSPDLALFLDTMAGFCPTDPLTYDAPAVSYVDAVNGARPPKRVAWSPNYGGALSVDRETRDICEKAAYRFQDMGCIVEEFHPDLGALEDAFMVLRSQHFVVDRELQLQAHRDLIKPDIIWNTEKGLAQTPSQLAWAERERAAFFRREHVAVADGALLRRLAFLHAAVQPVVEARALDAAPDAAEPGAVGGVELGDVVDARGAQALFHVLADAGEVAQVDVQDFFGDVGLVEEDEPVGLHDVGR